MLTLSIVSHRQGPLVECLLDDLARVASPHLSAIVVTHNVEESPIFVPEALVSITTVIHNARPKGFGANHNAAFARCTTALFAIVNPDIRLVDDPFDTLVACFAGLPPLGTHAVALASPHIDAPGGREEDAARELITPTRLLARRLHPETRRAVVAFDWLAGMFMVVRSDAFRTLGGFDARYFMYCEDFDLCARLRLAGHRIVVADARVVHDAQRASHRSLRHLGWHVASLLKMWSSPVFWRYRRALAARAT